MNTKKSLTIQRLVVGQMQTNCYLVYDNETHDAIIIDPGEDDSYIIETIQRLNLVPSKIIATHGHFDHILAAYSIQNTFHIPFAIHESDTFLVRQMASSAKHFLGFETHAVPPVIDKVLYEGTDEKVGSQSLKVLQTPGHTPGSISLIDETRSFALVGDLVFAGGGVGRTDFSYSDAQVLKQSIDSLLLYPDEMTVYSGHGEATTIRAIRNYHGKN